MLTIQEIDKAVCEWTIATGNSLTEKELESLVDSLYVALNKTEKVPSHFDAAMAQNPRFAEAIQHYNSAQIFLKHKNTDLARTHLNCMMNALVPFQFGILEAFQALTCELDGKRLDLVLEVLAADIPETWPTAMAHFVTSRDGSITAEDISKVPGLGQRIHEEGLKLLGIAKQMKSQAGNEVPGGNPVMPFMVPGKN